jgi:hypothetical protein
MEVTQETLQQVADIIAAESASRKMSEAAAARLRAQNDADRERKLDDKEFCRQFDTMLHDVGRMIILLRRISQDEKWDERHAWKVRRCLAMGWKISCPHDVVFFARLTPDEEKMSVDRFYREMTNNWPTPPREDGIKMVDCRAGKACKWITRRRPAQAPEGQFCSQICRQSFLAVQKRAKAGVSSSVN